MSIERATRGLVTSGFRLLFDHYQGRAMTRDVCEAFKQNVLHQIRQWYAEGVFQEIPGNMESKVIVQLREETLEIILAPDLQAILFPQESPESSLQSWGGIRQVRLLEPVPLFTFTPGDEISDSFQRPPRATKGAKSTPATSLPGRALELSRREPDDG